MISSIFRRNFSFYGLLNFAREKTLLKLGFNKKRKMGVYNLYEITLNREIWKKTILKYIINIKK